MRWPPLLSLLVIPVISACDDGGAPTATIAYSTSGCKSKQTGQALTVGPNVSAGYDGLECVAWEVAKEKTVFRLYNVEGGCGASYAGQAFVAAGGQTVTLSLTNPSESIAACGWCVYDFSFEVAGPATNANLTVAIERSNSNERGKEGTTTFALPAANQAVGVVCSYGNVHAMRDHARKAGLSGTRNFPCDTDAVSSNAGCRDQLACTPVDAGGTQTLCLQTCTAGADCGNNQLYSCSGGTCRLAPPAP